MDMVSGLSQKDRQAASAAAEIDDRCRRIRKDRREQSCPSVPDRRVAQAVVRFVSSSAAREQHVHGRRSFSGSGEALGGRLTDVGPAFSGHLPAQHVQLAQ
jgi:hypothetical protein